MSFPRKRESIFSFPSKYHSPTTNTLRKYFLKKEGFYKPFVVLVLRCRKIGKESNGEIKYGISRPDPPYSS